MIIENKGTKLVISSDENEPDITVTTKLFIKDIWQRLKFSYNMLFDNIKVDSVCNFNSDEEIRDTIDVLKEMLGEKKKNVFSVFRSLPEAIIPTKAYKGDSGWDLHSPIDFRLNPGETRRIDFGLIIEIEPGYEIQVRNRSGIVWKYSTMMALGVGTIDSGYRGHIMAPFYNFGREQVQFKRGDRLAQLVIKRTEDIELKESNIISLSTERSNGGFGSTGI